MAFHNAWKLLVFVLLCSSCYAQLSAVELQQVEYNVDSDKNDVDIVKDESTENESSQNDPKGNDIEEPFKKTTKPPYCLGCVINVPPEQPGVNEMVERAVSAMDQIVAAPTIHATPRVLGVQKQVVNGIQYYIQIEVSLSDCPPSTSSSRDQCNPLRDSPSIICEVIFLNQPWKDPKPQLMGNNCTDANSDNNVENFTPDDLLAVERSSGEESTYPMPQENGETQSSTETKLEATTPVVEDTLSGEKEDRNGRTVNVGTGMMKAMDSSEIDLINELADIAVRTLNELETGNSRKQVIDIVDAKKQIVNGLMYHLVLRVGSKSCADESADCQMQGWASQSICNVQLHRSWAEDAPYKAKVVNSECEEAWEEGREARHLTGNWFLQDMYDPEHSDCIKEVLSKAYNIVPKDIVTLSSLMRQDVSPKSIQMMAELKLPINKSTNPISDRKETLVLRPMVVCKHDAEKSSLAESADPTDIPTVVEVEPSRTKRSPQTETQNIPGGLSDSDKNSAEVSTVVDFAVKELDKSSNSGYEKKAVEVIEAKQQVVAGVLYHLKIKVANCKKGETSDCVQDHEVCSLKVWSRPWLNSNEVSDVSCSPSRSKRSIVPVFGGVEEADKNGAGVQEASTFAVNELTKREGTNSKLVLLEVVDAKKQVVQGISYHLTLKVSESNCNKGDPSVSNCQALPDGKQELCSLKVWSKPWLNETSVHDVDCKGRLSKRAANNIPGGLSDADKNSAQVRAAVDFAVTELAKSSNSGYEKKAVEVIEAKQQVVAGVLYHLKIKVANCKKGETSDCVQDNEVCSLKVWSRPWLNSMEISDVNCSPSRSKRSDVPVLGGVQDADKNGSGVQEASTFAVNELTKREGTNSKLVLLEVVDSKKQVVQGISYHLTLKVSESNCNKGDSSASNCQALPDAKRELCTLKVWSKPWLNEMSVHDVDCKAERTKRAVDNIRGGIKDADHNSPDVAEAIAFAVRKLDEGTNSIYKQKVIEVVKAQRQTVAGTLYHLTLTLGDSTCRKADEASADGCDLLPNADVRTCSVKVWSRPWLNDTSLTENDCGAGRRKRSVGSVGNLKDVEDLQDPYIQDIAEYSRSEIDKATNSMYSQKVVRVIEAKKQVVSGVLVHLKLELVRTGCSKKTKDLSSCQPLPDQKRQICEVKIWDRPWLKMRKVQSMKCADAQIISSQEPAVDATENLFSSFVNQFNKKYDSEFERQRRFEIFKENLNIIKELQDTEQGTATYGPTMFADLTHEEFKKRYLGLKPNLHQENSVPFPRAEIPNVQLPKEFDWRDHNAVTPVKNQGMCGSCWAFAVTGNVEGQYALKYKKLLSFSEQELVDCDKLDDGCQGGLPDSAYRALEQLGGLELEEEYPYEGKGESCAFNKTLTRVRIHGGLNISSNETDMAKWLAQNGPIAIGINANAMQFYMGGVSHPLKFLCSPSSLDHGVLIVGFGEHSEYSVAKSQDVKTFRHKHLLDGCTQKCAVELQNCCQAKSRILSRSRGTRYRKKLLPYWLIKNSWGKFWGEQGYYRVYRGDGSCGVNMMASSAIIE